MESTGKNTRRLLKQACSFKKTNWRVKTMMTSIYNLVHELHGVMNVPKDRISEMQG